MAEEDVINNIIKKEIRNRQKKFKDVSTNITSSKSSDEDEEYNLLLKQMLKSNKKKTSKKTVTRVDTVLPKGVKKKKRKNDKSKNNTSTAHKKNMLPEYILEAIVGKSISDSKSNLKKQKPKTHNGNKSITTTTIKASNLSNDKEYTSLLNTSVKKMKNNKRKRSKYKEINSKNDTSSVYMGKMLDDQTLKSIDCKSSPVIKKHKTNTHNKNKNVYSTTTNTSIISDDEEYTSLLNTSVKKMKNNERKRSKDMIGVDAVLTKEVKTPKRQKINSKNDTSSVYMGKMLDDQTFKSIDCKSSPAMKKHKTKTHNKKKNVYSTTTNTSITSHDEEYTSLLKKKNKKKKENEKKNFKTVIKDDTILPKGVKKTNQQMVNLKKDCSSVYTNKMNHKQNMESVICISSDSDSNSEVKKENSKINSLNKNLDSPAINTSNISDDEDYKSLLNTFVKKMKKKEKKRTKTEKKVDTVLPKEVKKTKQQKVNLKEDTSSVYINKMYHGNILESKYSDSFDSNNHAKKEKAKSYMDLTTMNTSNMSDDESYTSLLNSFVENMKKKKKKETKTEKKVDTILPKEVKKTKQQKVKKKTSSIYTNKIYHGHILESKDTNSSDSNSQVKKEKAKTCMDLTTMNTFSMSDDENYTLLLNTFAKKIKKKMKKRAKMFSPEIHFIQNPTDMEFPYLLGLEHVIDFVINDEMIAMPQASGKNVAVAVAANLAELQRDAVYIDSIRWR